mgnify:CR=1 FL=1
MKTRIKNKCNVWGVYYTHDEEYNPLGMIEIERDDSYRGITIDSIWDNETDANNRELFIRGNKAVGGIHIRACWVHHIKARKESWVDAPHRLIWKEVE